MTIHEEQLTALKKENRLLTKHNRKYHRNIKSTIPFVEIAFKLSEQNPELYLELLESVKSEMS